MYALKGTVCVCMCAEWLKENGIVAEMIWYAADNIVQSSQDHYVVCSM